MGRSDFALGWRSLRRAPIFSLAAVLTLIVGVGAVIVTWSFLRGVLLLPLPYPEPQRLVVLASRVAEVEVNDVSYLDARDWQASLTGLDAVATALIWDSVNLGPEAGRPGEDGRPAERVRAEYVSPSYFPLLGAPLALGRTFSADEDQPPIGSPVVVLSESLWRRRFGADPAIVGRNVQVDGRRCTVIGVLAGGFPSLSGAAQLWLPTTQVAAARGGVYLEDRSLRVLTVLGRLRPGVGASQLRAELAALATELERQHPETNRGYGGSVVALADWVYLGVPGFSSPRTTLLSLALAALALLLLGAANLSHLFQLRRLSRQADLAVRRALGATRGDLLRPAFVETLWLGVLGGLGAFLLARLGIAAALASGALPLPAFVRVAPRGGELFLALTLALGIATLAASLGVLRASPSALARALHSKPGIAAGRAPGTGSRALVFAQAALAMLLAAGASLAVASHARLHATGLGFAVDRLATFEVSLAPSTYDERPARARLAHQLRDEVAALPGVATVGLWGAALPGVGGGYLELVPEADVDRRPSETVRGINHHVSAGALTQLGIAVLRGRDLGPGDQPGTTLVAVVCANLARRLFPGQEPLGRRFRLGTAAEAPVAEVVGVAADVAHGSRLAGGEPLDLYLAYDQRPVRNLGLFVVTEGEGASLEPLVRERLRHLDPELAAFGFATARERLRAEEAPARLASRLGTACAAWGLLLAAIGVYGVLAYAVELRLETLAVRAALGAERWQLAASVAGPLLLWALGGLLAGSGAALLATCALRSLWYRTSPGEPLLFVVAGACLGGILVLACFFSVRRAWKLDPAQVLRLS